MRLEWNLGLRDIVALCCTMLHWFVYYEHKQKHCRLPKSFKIAGWDRSSFLFFIKTYRNAADGVKGHEAFVQAFCIHIPSESATMGTAFMSFLEHVQCSVQTCLVMIMLLKVWNSKPLRKPAKLWHYCFKQQKWWVSCRLAKQITLLNQLPWRRSPNCK